MDLMQVVNTGLVNISGKKAKTDSLTVADNFGKRHDNVIQKIENLIKNDDFNDLNFKATNYTDDRGIQHKKYTMDRKSFAMLAMGFTGKKAFQWKIKFVNAFEAMEQILLQQGNLEWQEYRQTGKAKRLELTDSIQQVVELAERQGSKNAGRYYTTITRLINRTAMGVKNVPDNFRDMLPASALHKLRLIEDCCAIWLKDAVMNSSDYHLPYRVLKQQLTALVDVMGPISD